MESDPCCELRLSCMNMTYHSGACRQAVLRTLQWSFSALGNLPAQTHAWISNLISVPSCRAAVISGSGLFPSEDPWGRPFDSQYFPDRKKQAGKLLANGLCGIFDATQMDLEMVKKVYWLQRLSSTTLVVMRTNVRPTSYEFIC